MRKRAPKYYQRSFPWLVFLLFGILAWAGYKGRPWNIRSADSYPSRLTSEGVTIAVEPLFLDTLAAQIFDKNDIVTRGIIPIALVIFNGNDFPVMLEGASVELIHGEDRIRTLAPNEVVHRLFAKEGKGVWVPQPIPRMPGGKTNSEAFQDFNHKFLSRKIVPPRDKGGGFLYLHLPESKDIREYLAKSRIYMPHIYRYDTGSSMIYFEIELEPAVGAIR